MSTVQQQPGDVQYIVGLVSATTIYPARHLAQTALIALSTANGNAFIQEGNVREIVSAATVNSLASVVLPGGGSTPEVVIQLPSSGTYYPVETARLVAYALSGSNGGAPVVIARIMRLVAAP